MTSTSGLSLCFSQTGMIRVSVTVTPYHGVADINAVTNMLSFSATSFGVAISLLFRILVWGCRVLFFTFITLHTVLAIIIQNIIIITLFYEGST